MQSFLLSVDSDYKSFLQHIIQTVDPTIMFNLTYIPTEFHINNHTGIPLSTCNDVAIGEQRRREHCTVIFNTVQPIVPPVRKPPFWYCALTQIFFSLPQLSVLLFFLYLFVVDKRTGYNECYIQ